MIDANLVSEWWTYRLSDFLMFSARTYHRLFELYNAEVWPAHAVALGLGAALAVVAWHGRAGSAAVVCGMLALVWCWVAWAFHWQRYATINWAAAWFAVAFAGQGLVLLAAGLRALGGPGSEPRRSANIGLALLLFALFVQPLIGVVMGRPWRQAELFGIAPDPTASATLGLLLMLRPADRAWPWALWPVPLLWCAVSGATSWAMHAPDAWLMPMVALLGLAAARHASGGSR